MNGSALHTLSRTALRIRIRMSCSQPANQDETGKFMTIGSVVARNFDGNMPAWAPRTMCSCVARNNS